MKVEEQNVATFNIGRMETAVAQIQASAKAFEILSSGLYSDAEFAIVREIAANAWDSHKAAGCPEKPFKIQIPTMLDPCFKVRDYGTSMSHEFMMTRVNTYFDSTKNDSNDEIGGFGLGIKSVFSYTSSFMIACFLDGMRRVYAYQIGEKGLPEISLMAELATTEPNGVEVSVPVKEEDYSKFKTAVQKTFAFYDVKPEVAGVELAIPEFQKKVAGTNWFIAGSHDVFPREVYVEMGGIAYPVDDSLHNLRYYSRNQTLFIKAGIGDIDITPNREQVKMTDRTRKFIKEALKNVEQEIFDLIQTKVNDQKFTNYWDMIDYLGQFKGDMINRLGFKVENVKFNGKAYDERHFTVKAEALPVRSDPADPLSAIVPGVMTAEMVAGIERFGSWELSRSDRIKKEQSSWRNDRELHIDRLARPHPIVVMEERQGLHVARWMKENGTRYISVVHAKTGTAKAVVAGIKDRIEHFDKVHDAADLTYDKSLFTSGGAKQTRKLYIYHSGTYDAVRRTEIDMATLPATMNYFETDGRQKGTVFGRDVDFKHNSDLINIAKQWLGASGEIYYLTEAMIKKIEKHRPDIKLVKAEDALTAMVEDKVRAAAVNYFSNDLSTIQAPFNKSYGSGWRIDTAMSFWAKTFGLDDYVAAKEEISKANPDQRLEKMCQLITKKGIHELFAEYGIQVRSVSSPSFEQMAAKMPYAFAFVESYSQQDVVDHIQSVMGWKLKDASQIVADPDDCD